MRVVLQCQKMKDRPEFEPIHLYTVPVDLEDGSSSLVLVPDSAEAGVHCPETAVKDAESKWSGRERTMLEQLGTFGAQGASATEWQEAGAVVGVSRASFFRAVKDLQSSGCVEKFDAAGKSRYRVTEATPESDIDDGFVDDDDLDDFEW